MLTIAQISDLHVTASEGPLDPGRNMARLREVFASLLALQPRPALVLASGDLVERASGPEYLELKRELGDLGLPVYFGVGNHDARAPFLEVFGGPFARTDLHGFVQYVVDVEDFRVVMCDTLDEGAHGGAFCDRRADWLAHTLDAAPDRPTLVVLHHPPVLSGIAWMDPPPDAPWISNLERVLRRRRQVQAVAAGHLHRGMATRFAGHPLVVAPATAIQLALNLTPLDVRHPDGRAMLVDEPPAYLLHMWEAGRLVSHTVVAGSYPAAVVYERPLSSA